MIDSMTKYSFILLNGEQEGFLDRLQELGLVDITRSVKPVDAQSTALLTDAESARGHLRPGRLRASRRRRPGRRSTALPGSKRP